MPSRRCFVLSLALCFLAGVAPAQQSYKQPQAQQYIKILEDPHRIERLNPPEIIGKLELRPGYVVADIGSGSGLFTRPMAKAVQPSGQVYAVDIDPDLLKHVQKTAKSGGIANITTVLAPEDSPGLPAGSVDVALICDTLHHIARRQEYLANLRLCMKPSGRLAIIDFKDDWPAGHESLRFELADLDRWTAAAGFTKIAEFDTVPGNFFRIYKIAAGQEQLQKDQEWRAYAGGLVFIAGTNDSRLRAFDSESGKELWSARLEASDHARPVTYMADGRQFVVVAAGGGGYFSSTVSDALAAHALPQ